MSTQGVQQGPDQIADGVNPSLLASVDASGAVEALQDAITPSGREVAVHATEGGDTVLGSDWLFGMLLVELRLMNYLLAIGHNVTEDLDLLRADFAAQIGIDDVR